MVILNIFNNDANDQIIVSIDNSISRNESKRSICFNLKTDNSNITSDDIAKFLTNLAVELLADNDSNLKFNDKVSNKQSEFIIHLINNFVESFNEEYKKQSNEFKNKIKALSNK